MSSNLPRHSRQANDKEIALAPRAIDLDSECDVRLYNYKLIMTARPSAHLSGREPGLSRIEPFGLSKPVGNIELGAQFLEPGTASWSWSASRAEAGCSTQALPERDQGRDRARRPRPHSRRHPRLEAGQAR